MFKTFDSSSIISASYDKVLMTLEVTFKRGAVYVYNNVPNYIVDELFNATSTGKYFQANIAKAYNFTEVNYYG